MRKGCFIVAGGLLLVLLVTGGTLLCVPYTRALLLGWYHGEHFFQGKPTRLWREAIREQEKLGIKSPRISRGKIAGGRDIVRLQRIVDIELHHVRGPNRAIRMERRIVGMARRERKSSIRL